MSSNVIVRIGADPEFFVKGYTKPTTSKGPHEKSKHFKTPKELAHEENKIVPICGLVGGTKEKPIVVSHREIASGHERHGDFAYQEDGVAFEYNVPATSFQEDFTSYIIGMNTWATSLLQSKGLTPDFDTVSHKFQAKDLQSTSARTIGCLPDNDAWADNELLQRKPFTSDDLGDTRFVGGHIHLQYNKEAIPPHIMAQFLDVALALPCIGLDKQGERRKFYGIPGLFREKPYGIEYRTLSNFWLNPKYVPSYLIHYIAGSVINIGSLARTPDIAKAVYDKVPWIDVRDAIANEDNMASVDITSWLREACPEAFSNIGSLLQIAKHKSKSFDNLEAFG